MELATLKQGSLDGMLVVVSRDLKRAVAVPQVAPNLLDALQCWDAVAGRLASAADALGDGWRDGREQMQLHLQWDGERFGERLRCKPSSPTAATGPSA